MLDAGAKPAEFLRAGQKLLSAEDPETSCWRTCFARVIPFPCKFLLHLGREALVSPRAPGGWAGRLVVSCSPLVWGFILAGCGWESPAQQEVGGTPEPPRAAWLLWGSRWPAQGGCCGAGPCQPAPKWLRTGLELVHALIPLPWEHEESPSSLEPRQSSSQSTHGAPSRLQLCRGISSASSVAAQHLTAHLQTTSLP